MRGCDFLWRRETSSGESPDARDDPLSSRVGVDPRRVCDCVGQPVLAQPQLGADGLGDTALAWILESRRRGSQADGDLTVRATCIPSAARKTRRPTGRVEGAHRSREDHAGHRQDVSAQRARGDGLRWSRDRRAGKGRRYDRSRSRSRPSSIRAGANSNWSSHPPPATDASSPTPRGCTTGCRTPRWGRLVSTSLGSERRRRLAWTRMNGSTRSYGTLRVGNGSRIWK
jgi:hypothetical protein